jgi:hypothetical protein
VLVIACAVTFHANAESTAYTSAVVAHGELVRHSLGHRLLHHYRLLDNLDRRSLNVYRLRSNPGLLSVLVDGHWGRLVLLLLLLRSG